MSTIKAIHPVLPVRSVEDALEFYGKLGFKHAFTDATSPEFPKSYAGVRREGAEIHLQRHDETTFKNGGAMQLRFFVDDPTALFAEWQPLGVLGERTAVKEQPWGTREFGFYDPDGNALFFYEDL